jgi:hypothetical protein
MCSSSTGTPAQAACASLAQAANGGLSGLRQHRLASGWFEPRERQLADGRHLRRRDAAELRARRRRRTGVRRGGQQLVDRLAHGLDRVVPREARDRRRISAMRSARLYGVSDSAQRHASMNDGASAPMRTTSPYIATTSWHRRADHGFSAAMYSSVLSG